MKKLVYVRYNINVKMSVSEISSCYFIESPLLKSLTSLVCSTCRPGALCLNRKLLWAEGHSDSLLQMPENV